MTDTPTFDDNPIATDFELVNQYDAPDFTKYRLKSGAATVDVALVELPEEDADDYIADRREDLQKMSVDVPKPYTSEIDTHEQAEPIDFTEKEGKIYGTAHADPEYNLILEGRDQLERYRYVVTWRYFPEQERLAEIEVYVPTDVPAEDALALANALTL